MSNVTIHFRDGKTEKIKDTGRPGGSYSVQVVYEGGVVTVIDCYGFRTSWPLDLVEKVEERPLRY